MGFTIKDIARMAGVSTATVSLVLSDHPRISPGTKASVRKILDQVGFVPNALAQSFVRRTQRTLGMAMILGPGQALQNPYVFEMMTGVQAGCQEEGFSLMVLPMSSLKPGTGYVLDLWKGKRIDGLVIQYLPGLDPDILRLEEAGLPLGILGNPGIPVKSPWIDGDNPGAGGFAWQVLEARGYRRPWFVIREDSGIERDRWDGFHRAAQAQGVQAELKVLPEGQFLTPQEIPDHRDAVVCADHYLALQLLEIPQGLLTFDDLPYLDRLREGLATVDIDVYGLGCEMGRTLTQWIQNPGPPRQTALPLFKLKDRPSLGPRAPNPGPN